MKINKKQWELAKHWENNYYPVDADTYYKYEHFIGYAKRLNGYQWRNTNFNELNY